MTCLDSPTDGARCVCIVGYSLSGSQCVDNNECLEDRDICGEQNVCVNEKGYYRCEPKEGYIQIEPAVAIGMKSRFQSEKNLTSLDKVYQVFFVFVY